MRHAKAVRDHEAESDRARGLTARGQRDAEAAGAALRAIKVVPDVALVSSALRTRETFSRLGLGLTARFEDALYMAEPETIFDLAAARSERSVLIVGHNPGLHDLAARFVAQSGDRAPEAMALLDGLPTAAFAVFAVAGEVVNAAGAQLVAAWRPRSGD